MLNYMNYLKNMQSATKPSHIHKTQIIKGLSAEPQKNLD